MVDLERTKDSQRSIKLTEMDQPIDWSEDGRALDVDDSDAEIAVTAGVARRLDEPDPETDESDESDVSEQSEQTEESDSNSEVSEDSEQSIEEQAAEYVENAEAQSDDEATTEVDDTES